MQWQSFSSRIFLYHLTFHIMMCCAAARQTAFAAASSEQGGARAGARPVGPNKQQGLHWPEQANHNKQVSFVRSCHDVQTVYADCAPDGSRSDAILKSATALAQTGHRQQQPSKLRNAWQLQQFPGAGPLARPWVGGACNKFFSIVACNC